LPPRDYGSGKGTERGGKRKGKTRCSGKTEGNEDKQLWGKTLRRRLIIAHKSPLFRKKSLSRVWRKSEDAAPTEKRNLKRSKEENNLDVRKHFLNAFRLGTCGGGEGEFVPGGNETKRLIDTGGRSVEGNSLKSRGTGVTKIINQNLERNFRKMWCANRQSGGKLHRHQVENWGEAKKILMRRQGDRRNHVLESLGGGSMYIILR